MAHRLAHRPGLLRTLTLGALAAAVLAAAARPAAAQGPPPDPEAQRKFDAIVWQHGPCTVNVGDLAQVKVPAGYKFTGAAGARSLLELLHNPTSPRDLGLLCPEKLEWFITFDFDAVGYVKDDEKNNLDADVILESLRKGNEQGNVERRRRGWEPVTLLGWQQAPHYDEQTHNLIWATRLSGANGLVSVNYNTRLLGRGGVMSVNLVTSPERLPAVLPTYQNILSGYSYKTGHRYSEFRAGDKVAEYGLTALVAGGAVALAAKSGFLAKFGKVIIGGIVALVVGIGSLFKKLFGGREASA
jgi:uncharacterized membrane-anchored protein